MLYLSAILGMFLICAYAAYHYLETPPHTFPINKGIVIAEGATVSEISQFLEQQHVIRSANTFRLLVWKNKNEANLKAGTYYFESPESLAEIERVLVAGAHLVPHARVTFPEGFRAKDIPKLLRSSLPNMEIDTAYAAQYEGYLFPDTYHVSSNMSFTELIDTMRQTYTDRTQRIMYDLDTDSLSEAEVVILASLVEREANTEESMRIVAGILLNRLRDNMPLQADATFDYLLDKESSELTLEDLDIDSPYNTYRNIGLPPTPIANPGIMAIQAVIEPTTTAYYYYLTDSEGAFHYAKTFEEHKKNKERYLR